MSDIVIKIDNVSKKYRIGARKGQHDTLRDHIMDGFKGLMVRKSPPPGVSAAQNGAEADSIWALQDICLEINKGEVVGFIGRNGAGKSTLLKLLSRITEPTTGRIEMRGRIGSLLEVGAGFHAELTGRENIYLSGAVLGMKKAEIVNKFDEIVEFSGVDKFIDTPVKRYSSGMYVRLAFAVAANLDPDILIVDEVLAVGDAAFRLKCQAKMEDIRDRGRTILMVSHNFDVITATCGRVVLLEGGKIIRSGAPQDVIPYYLKPGQNVDSTIEWDNPETAPGNETARLRKVRICGGDGNTLDAVDIRHPVGIEMVYDVLIPGQILVPNFHVFNQNGVQVFVAVDQDAAWHRRPRPAGQYVSTAWIPGNLLAEGEYHVGAAVSTFFPMIVHFDKRDVVGFTVSDSFDGSTARGDYAGHMPGVVRPLLRWTTVYTDELIEKTG
jgi:lipopolysaccharide transport system ATP-binding protein